MRKSLRKQSSTILKKKQTKIKKDNKFKERFKHLCDNYCKFINLLINGIFRNANLIKKKLLIYKNKKPYEAKNNKKERT